MKLDITLPLFLLTNPILSQGIRGMYVWMLFGIFVLVFLCCKGLNKLKHVFLKEPYEKYHLSIKCITRMSMVIALNIALIFTISWLSGQFVSLMFRVFPGSRFMFETVFVSMGGILFGSILGMFVGGATNLLTVIFTSSVFNFGYFVSSLMKGFFGGIIMNILKKNKIDSCIKGATYSIAYTTILCCFFYMFLPSKISGSVLSVTFTWEPIDVILFVSIISALLTIVLLVASTLDFCKYINWNMNQRIKNLLIIMTAMWISYICIDIAALPTFDVKVSSLPYEQFLLMRIMTAIPSVALASIFVWYIHGLKLIRNEFDHFEVEEQKRSKKIALPTNLLRM